MNIILTEVVEKLGRVGDLVKVKDGYARNYLFPRNLAMIATDHNVKRIEKEKTKRLAIYEEQKKVAQVEGERLSKISITISVAVTEEEKLYGNVQESDIIKALEAQGVQIEKRQLVLEKSIDVLGIFDIGVKLHPEVIAKIRLWVTKK